MTDQKQKKSFKASLVLGLVRLLSVLPFKLSRLVLRPIAWLQILLPNRSKQTIELNLAYCGIDHSDYDHARIRNGSIIHSANLIAESSWIWRHSYAQNRRLIKSVKGEDKIASESGGKLIISPHLGNWELVFAFLANEYQSAGLYRPPRIEALDPLIQKGRGGPTFPTDARGVRQILKWLKKDGSLFLLPDQQPPDGSGVFAEFFGKPAYTMTFLHGLLKRTSASLWMAYAIQKPDGYELNIYPLEVSTELDPEAFNLILNKYLEEAIMRAPEQYQWSYKRFKKTPDGSPSIYQ